MQNKNYLKVTWTPPTIFPKEKEKMYLHAEVKPFKTIFSDCRGTFRI
jgi:hypothetical protein